jgi:zinc protease
MVRRSVRDYTGGTMKRARLLGLFLLVLIGACGPAAAPVPAAPPAPVATVATPAAAVDPMDQPTPVTAEVRTGKLANGLSYYVMRHQKPEKRAALWLAVNTGSVLEDDDQRGLAHFVEHMAFNGTKRFPKAEIVDYIEKVGMTFGADVNAFTSFDETVYQLTVPTDRAVLTKGLDIVRDWAGDVTFDPVEVDKERGVVLEEWRLGRGAGARIRDKQFPIIFQGSRYAERLPIGLPEVLKTAKRDTLYRFYKDWYRPGLMAVIAVGDFDPAAIEKEIQARFADLRDPEKPRPRTMPPVPHEHEPAVTIATDPEMRMTSVAVYDKIDRRPNASKRDYRRTLVEQLYHQMLNARFAELREDPAAPFVSAGSSTQSLVRTSDAFVRSATVKEGQVEETIKILFREISRVERYGFLASELERAKKDVVTRAEQAAREKDKTNMRQFAAEISRNFLDAEQMPGADTELEWTKELTATITLDELNHLAMNWGGAKGRVVAIAAPSGTKLPGDKDVLAIAKAATEAPVAAWQDAPPDKPLVATPPTPGKVVKTKHDDAADATVWTLANGVRVIVKSTPFQNDSITFTGWERGGSSLVPDKDFGQARFADDVVSASGAGDFDATMLRKMLAGKVVNAGVALGELSVGAFGNTRPADLETTLQLLYLKLTAPRRDERAFARWKAQQTELERHRKESPDQQFSDAMTELLTNNHLRRRPVTPEMIAEVDLDKALGVYKNRFGDFGDFTFVFVGNVDLAKLQPLVETYLGGLPSKGRKEKWKDVGVKYAKGKVTKTVVAGTEPKSHVSITFSGDDKWSLDGERDARVLQMGLRMRLREVLREDMGGVYGVSISGGLVREPKPRRSFTVSFGCDPDNVDKLEEAVFAEIAKIQKDGLGDSYVSKITEQLRRSHEVDLKENRYWMGLLRSVYYYGDDFTALNDVEATVKRATTANLKASAQRFFDDKNTVIGVLKPKSPAAASP